MENYFISKDCFSLVLLGRTAVIIVNNMTFTDFVVFHLKPKLIISSVFWSLSFGDLINLWNNATITNNIIICSWTINKPRFISCCYSNSHFFKSHIEIISSNCSFLSYLICYIYTLIFTSDWKDKIHPQKKKEDPVTKVSYSF